MFAAETSAATTATFSTPGAYLFQLIADDGTMSVDDLVAVFVHPEWPPRGRPIRIEAEHMLLEFHAVKDAPFASAGKYVRKFTAMTTTPTTLYTRLQLPAGNYDVVGGYFDENDGRARAELELARGDFLGEHKRLLRQEWTYDQDLAGSEPSEQTAARKHLGENVPLQPGDAMRITTLADKNEWPTVDYIEFIPKE
ncbi:MAG: hypothetical protein O3A00_18670 [Planctomycetota bacterium]|nr:hypothetical protein [Planctomycetota bacterium]